MKYSIRILNRHGRFAGFLSYKGRTAWSVETCRRRIAHAVESYGMIYRGCTFFIVDQDGMPLTAKTN